MISLGMLRDQFAELGTWHRPLEDRGEWQSLLDNGRVRLDLVMLIACALALTTYGALVSEPARGSMAVNSVLAAAIGFMLVIAALIRRLPIGIVHVSLGAASAFVSLFFAASTTYLALADDRAITPVTMEYPVLFGAMNYVALRRGATVLLNALMIGAVLAALTIYAAQLNAERFHAEVTVALFGAALLGAGAYLSLNLVAATREHNLIQLAGVREHLVALEARHRLADEIQGYRQELARLNGVAMAETLASSIAHEVMQPLTLALNSATGVQSMLAANAAAPQPALDRTGDTIEQIERAIGVIRAIRGMTSRNEALPAVFDAREVCRKFVNLLEGGLAREQVRLTYREPQGAAFVNGREEQIGQIIMNLVSNGVEALLPSPARRELVITLSRSRGWCSIAVADTGRGVSEAERERAFDAFYTTKSGGTGLGLAICADIARQHGGYLTLEPGDPHGTVATLSLPLAEPAEAAREGEAALG